MRPLIATQIGKTRELTTPSYSIPLAFLLSLKELSATQWLCSPACMMGMPMGEIAIIGIVTADPPQ
jgi:hypothetical protein